MIQHSNHFEHLIHHLSHHHRLLSTKPIVVYEQNIDFMHVSTLKLSILSREASHSHSKHKVDDSNSSISIPLLSVAIYRTEILISAQVAVRVSWSCQFEGSAIDQHQSVRNLSTGKHA